MSDPTATAIEILVLILLAAAIPVSYHLGRNAPSHQEEHAEPPTMYCELQKTLPGIDSMVPRALRCKRAAGDGFLCKAPPVME